jgi:hypothetical protein
MPISDLDLASKMVSLSQNARSRRLEFTLSLPRLRQLMTRRTCFYTGTPLVDDPSSPNHRTIDRMDASLGYTDDNCVACANFFNQKKNNLTISEIEMMYKAIQKLKA